MENKHPHEIDPSGWSAPLTGKVAEWVKKHSNTLWTLHADFCRENPKERVSMSEFGAFMYTQCRH